MEHDSRLKLHCVPILDTKQKKNIIKKITQTKTMAKRKTTSKKSVQQKGKIARMTKKAEESKDVAEETEEEEEEYSYVLDHANADFQRHGFKPPEHAMTVARLRCILDTLPDDMLLIKQSDDKGNCYSSVSGLDSDVIYSADGHTYDPTLSADDYDMSTKAFEFIVNRAPRCAIFY